MSTRRSIRCLALALGATLMLPGSVAAQHRAQVKSPDGRNEVTVGIRDGRLSYSVQRDGRPALLPSGLGFEFRGAAPLRDNLRIVDTLRQTVDETWTQPWGEVARVRNHYHELRVGVAETASPKARCHPLAEGVVRSDRA